MSLQAFFHSLDKNKWKGLLLFAAILLTLVCLRYNAVIQNLGNEKLLEPWGDGLKTYTNAIYHIDYSQENAWYDGMNYPYGEHIVPATELPGVAMLLKSLKGVFPNISKYLVTAIHLELLLAIFLCGLFLFAIFRMLELPTWYSMIVAIGLTFLAPENIRFAAHFGLAQPFIVPLILYLLLLFERKKSYVTSSLIGLALVLTSLLHFYYFGINVFIISFYFFCRLLFQKEKEVANDASFLQKITHSAKFKYALQMIPYYCLMTIVPLLFFYFWMLGPDPVLDRNPTPFGFFTYVAKPQGVFLWEGNPLFRPLQQLFSSVDFEGKVYIGMIAVGLCVTLLGRWIWSRFKKPFLPLLETKNEPYLAAAFGMAVILLLFSMCIPFTWSPFRFLADLLGPIKQFRSLGRFAWAFYYVINIIGFYILYHYLKRVGFVLILGLLLLEAYQFSHQQNYRMQTVDYWTTGEPYTAIEGIDFTQFQATVPIPYFNWGTNNFDEKVEGFSAQKCYVLGMQTGLPTTGAQLTRSSISQAFKQWQLVLAPYRKPVIFEDFKNDKNLLLVWFNNAKKANYPEFKHLKNGAKSIYKKGELEFFDTELSDFENRITQKKMDIQEALFSDSLFSINQFQSTDSTDNFVFKNFDKQPAEKTYLSSGATSGKLNEWNELFFDKLPNVVVDAVYNFQIWTWLKDNKLTHTRLTLKEIDDDGNTLQSQDFAVWPNLKTLDPNGWGLVNYSFKPKSKNSRFQIGFQGDPKDDRVQFFDELLIKPVSTHLYQKKEGYLWMDNLSFEAF